MSAPRRRPFVVAGVLLVLGGFPGPAPAADGPPAISSRELMAREWDLNRDGTIDEGEAEVARSKMRRQQAELKAKAMAGRPAVNRDEPAQSEEQPPRTGLLGPAGDEPEPRRRERPAEPRRQDQTGAARPQDQAGDPRRRDQAAEPRPPVVTGGARAGGLSRPGYGSNVPRGDLNAGRPIPPRTAGPRPPMTGGLLPVPRRPPADSPAPVARPRVTAEDMPY
ncbi:MAG: hypothetical protein ACK5SI_07705 [Planctomycetia bacterium]|jgi:hypothetical protein